MASAAQVPGSRTLCGAIEEGAATQYDALRDGLLSELAPQGAVETVTFEEILHAAWSLSRFRAIEGEISRGTRDDVTDPEIRGALDRLARNRERAQRAWYRARQELHDIQSARPRRPSKPAPPVVEFASRPALIL